MSSQVYARRGPMWSHNQPMKSRTRTVIATEAMVRFPICALVKWNSWRITGISGAMPNHPKKHRKNASHVMWNARMGALEKSLRRMRLALLRRIIESLLLGFLGFNSNRLVPGDSSRISEHPFASARLNDMASNVEGTYGTTRVFSATLPRRLKR